MTVEAKGTPVYASERQQSMLAEARALGRVEVIALAEQLGVTPETVRRDLTALESRGLVRRVHGGALPVERLDAEISVATRMAKASAEKKRIAVRALEEIPRGGSILLDSGTTTYALAEQLPTDQGLTVVTNSVSVAALLQGRAGTELLLLGGRVRDRTGAAVGGWVVTALSDLCVDVAFLGTNGYAVERGFTTPDQVEAAAKRAMAGAARRVVVLSDASKAGQVHLHRFLGVDEAGMLITDDALDDETAERLENAGTEVVRT